MQDGNFHELNPAKKNSPLNSEKTWVLEKVVYYGHTSRKVWQLMRLVIPVRRTAWVTARCNAFS
jgi:hypothetical protein